MEQLLYRRQFLISEQEEEIAGSFSHCVFNKRHVYCHSDLACQQVAVGTRSVMLFGYIIDYRYPMFNDKELLLKYLEESGDSHGFIKNTFPSGGRWALYYSDENDSLIFNDATGMRQVYYSTGSKLLIASSEMLLVRVLGVQRSARVQSEFVQQIKHADATWFPNTATNYDEIKCLIPNTYYNVTTRNVSRFWPQQRLNMVFRDSVNMLHEILQKTPAALATRYPNHILGTTSGADSRLTIGYFKNFGTVPFYIYTIRNSKLSHNSKDIEIPAKLAQHMAIQHLVIEHYEHQDAQFRDIYCANNANFKPTYFEMAYNMFCEYPQQYLSVQSVMNEIARQHYAYVPYIPDVHDVKHFTDYGHLAFAHNEISEWIVGPRRVQKHMNLRVEDLFFMEQRMGRWNSTNRSDWDMIQEVFEPWNNRLIWLIAMSVHPKHKKHVDNDIYKALFALSWPGHNEVEIHRGHEVNYRKYRFRKALSKLKREILRRS